MLMKCNDNKLSFHNSVLTFNCIKQMFGTKTHFKTIFFKNPY